MHIQSAAGLLIPNYGFNIIAIRELWVFWNRGGDSEHLLIGGVESSPDWSSY